MTIKSRIFKIIYVCLTISGAPIGDVSVAFCVHSRFSKLIHGTPDQNF